MINSLLAAKEATGKSFTHIGQELGLTNTYAAQLFYNQVSACMLPTNQGMCSAHTHA